MNVLTNITSQFAIDGQVIEIKPLGEGFINDTFIVKTDNSSYLLQRKNKNIFLDIPGMMDNIDKITSHLKDKVIALNRDPLREVLTLVKTKDNMLYHLEEDEYWTMCLYINDHIVFEKADSPNLAKAGGSGIGKFQAMLSDFKGQLVDTLPGFHNIKFRFEQWDKAIKEDVKGRVKSLSEEIAWIEDRRAEMLNFWTLVENGTIPQRITHNDTKISNILFDKDRNVLCVIDLDTVLSSTVLNDFGDAIRSYTNTGLEDDKDLKNVSMDINLFKGFTEGYIEEAHSFLNPTELKYLAFSAKYITYEQVLRFLMDYINGDTYYKIKYPEHNLVRTCAQYRLLESIESQMNEMNNVVKKCSKFV